MAVACDFNLGSAKANQPASTYTLTTTHLASAGTRVVVLVSFYGDAAHAVTGVTCPGFTFTQDKRVANTNNYFDMWSCPFPSGLASGTVISVTVQNSWSGGVLVGALSISGVDMTNGGGVDTTASATTTGTNWSSGAANAIVGGISIGGAGNECASTSETATATSPATIVHHDWESVSQQGLATADLVVAAGAAGAVAGTIANTSTATTEALVVYKDGWLLTSTTFPWFVGVNSP